MERKKITVLDLQRKRDAGEKITMLTAFDYATGKIADEAGIDVLLVGDSLGMVILGREHTVSVTMEEVLHHCEGVACGARHPLLVGDMPFMSYQVDVKEAIRNAGRFLKEGGMDVVKLEGGREIAATTKAIVDAGVPVMGHIGLTPQHVSKYGGYRVQGKDVASARALIDDALALEDAGLFCLSLEAVPAPVARLITERVQIPTIGIGSGPHCDGQTLLIYDLVGMFDRFVPKYVKQYARIYPQMLEAVETYRQEVIEGAFPDAEHSYGMPEEALQELLKELGEEPA